MCAGIGDFAKGRNFTKAVPRSTMTANEALDDYLDKRDAELNADFGDDWDDENDTFNQAPMMTSAPDAQERRRFAQESEALRSEGALLSGGRRGELYEQPRPVQNMVRGIDLNGQATLGMIHALGVMLRSQWVRQQETQKQLDGLIRQLDVRLPLDATISAMARRAQATTDSDRAADYLYEKAGNLLYASDLRV